MGSLVWGFVDISRLQDGHSEKRAITHMTHNRKLSVLLSRIGLKLSIVGGVILSLATVGQNQVFSTN